MRKLMVVVALCAIAAACKGESDEVAAHKDLAAPVAIAAAPEVAPAAGVPPSLALGPFRIGMTRAEAEAASDVSSETMGSIEGEDYPVLVARTASVEYLVWLMDRDGKSDVWRVTTEAVGVVAPGGGKVGDTIDDLKRAYPDGSVLLTIEDGLHYSFSGGDFGPFFHLDQNGIDADCVIYKEGCPTDLEQRKTVLVRVG